MSTILFCFALSSQSSYAAFMPQLTVKYTEEGLKLEDFLRQRIPAAPVSYLRQLFKAGKVKRSGCLADQTTIVHHNDCIQLPDSSRLLELLKSRVRPKTIPEIFYESREILIVYKPSGLAVHSSKGHEKDNLTDRVKSHYGRQQAAFQIAPIQRLDLETSGPVLFGKGKKSCSALGKLFMSGQVKKGYLALVKGKIEKDGQLATNIPAKGKVKPAMTSYQVLASNNTASLLGIRLHTGRQHQIRRQLADLGHPLFGDRRYHGPCPKNLGRLFLHCQNLAFVDPFNKQTIDIGCPLPETLERFLKRIDIHTVKI